LFSGDITQKGYDKKRKKLLAPFMQPQIKDDSNNVIANQASSGFLSLTYFWFQIS